MEALREATADLTVYVHPSNAADVRGAVARQLSTLLFSYEDRFDGVLLAHEVQFEGENEDKDGKQVIKAKILDGLVPYFGVPVTANLLLFSPQPEMILEGKVEMLCKESIHAIVLGVFSAAIMVDDIPETFKFKRRGEGGKFISQLDKRHVIKKGSMILFSVKRVDTEMNCHITGSLKTPHTGCMRWLSVHDAEYASEISSGKRKSRDNIKGEQNVQDRTIVNLQGSVVNSERPRKSQKRTVRSDDAIQFFFKSHRLAILLTCFWRHCFAPAACAYHIAEVVAMVEIREMVFLLGSEAASQSINASKFRRSINCTMMM